MTTTPSQQTDVLPAVPPGDSRAGLAELRAADITAWFGSHKVLDRVSLTMPAGGITALIGPSGCGKSTFLRILNRMHELVPSAALAGEVLLDGEDIYDPRRSSIDARRAIGMVFQKPNPFPAMSIQRERPGRAQAHRHPGRPRGEGRARRVAACARAASGTRSRTGSTPPAAACPAASSSACASPGRSRSSRGCC